MNATLDEQTAAPPELSHGLRPHFNALAQFHSTKALAASSLYRELLPEIERVLGSVVVEEHAPERARESARGDAVRATAWNIERGKQLEGILRALEDDARMRGSDVLLLTELDYGMARTGNRFVAREIARRLGLNFAFAPCYIALNKGSGLEASTEGENTHALHGNALLSRHPLRRPHSLALPNGKDKM